MNVVNKIFGKWEIKRRRWLRPVVVYKDDHTVPIVLCKEKKSIIELIHVMMTTYLLLSVYCTLTQGVGFEGDERREGIDKKLAIQRI